LTTAYVTHWLSERCTTEPITMTSCDVSVMDDD